MIQLSIPISNEEISKLKVGDQVALSGIMFTARDAAHKFMIENFIQSEPPKEEEELFQILKKELDAGVIYHCGPVVRKSNGKWEFVAAGPTTSIREEPYEHQIIEHFNVKAVIGKGGMGPKTLAACQKHKAVYLHAVGGAAAVLAEAVKEVVDVYKMEFGVPEAFWKIRVEKFPAVVTMDSHGNSLHDKIETASKNELHTMIAEF
ncbi:fumarate hydrolyase [candidate division KSB1 bacterium]|nr:fumarate hydrolyase [candidate division KSB1 bacterium]NIR69769.1 fumarate hydrolyase [candidate division KSB1 bacterium]NIS22952.1 fumarate hydrolyase [candidate division KSB1 bacterium]NIT69809.1 fumarate hydrolyase [candidate division KSB1 bacterium]NIU23483.1 fumarate hydrolyase [candidate division KSB1 bacterium]